MSHIRKPLSAVNIFVVILGMFFIIEGFWGLFSPVVFGVLTTNLLHAVIHLILGFGGVFLGLRNRGRNYSFFVGVLLLVVGLLYFIPGGEKLVVDILNVNSAVATLNIAVSVIAIILALLTPKTPVTHSGTLKLS